MALPKPVDNIYEAAFSSIENAKQARDRRLNGAFAGAEQSPNRLELERWLIDYSQPCRVCAGTVRFSTYEDFNRDCYIFKATCHGVTTNINVDYYQLVNARDLYSMIEQITRELVQQLEAQSRRPSYKAARGGEYQPGGIVKDQPIYRGKYWELELLDELSNSQPVAEASKPGVDVLMPPRTKRKLVLR